MRMRALASLVFGIAALAGVAHAKSPVVVELFTSQGCGSCVSADQLIGDLADRPHVLALTFGVDYWDYLGWQDTFAKSAFTDRQKAYLKPLALRDVYTPQAVVDGRLQAAANHPDAVDKLIKQAARDHDKPPKIVAARGARIAVGSGHAPKGGADVWLVRYDPRVVQVPIRRGENSGRTLPHKNIVRELTHLGQWTGDAKTLALPPQTDPALRAAILVQKPGGGPILAAAKI